MKRRTNGFKLSFAMIVITALAVMTMGPLRAATPNPSPASTGYEVWPIVISGSYTASTTPVVFTSPWPFRVVGISAYARTIKTSSGNETYTVDVQQGTTSLLSSPVAVSAQATNYSGTLAANPAIPDEAAVSVILTLGGTSPNITDVTVLLVVKRL